MSQLTNEQCLARLRQIYRDAFKLPQDKHVDSSVIILWAEKPELWAEHQIRHRNWSWYAAEAVVRSARVLRKRAALAVLNAAATPPGIDPFDPLMPAAEPQA